MGILPPIPQRHPVGRQREKAHRFEPHGFLPTPRRAKAEPSAGGLSGTSPPPDVTRAPPERRRRSFRAAVVYSPRCARFDHFSLSLSPRWQRQPRRAGRRPRSAIRSRPRSRGGRRSVRTHQSKNEDWEQVKGITAPVMAEAEAALRSGRRLFALQRLAAARTLLSASLYAAERTERERQDEAAFEAEWARMGKVLRADLSPPSPTALDGIRPAAVRALAEAALPQIKIFYDTSLDYARNTMPASGIFYHRGSARAAGVRRVCPDARRAIFRSPAAAAFARPRARRARGSHPRRVPAPRLDRQARRFHRRQRDAEGGARARCRGAALRGAVALSAGGAAPGPSRREEGDRSTRRRSGRSARACPPAAWTTRSGASSSSRPRPISRRRRPAPCPRGPR